MDKTLWSKGKQEEVVPRLPNQSLQKRKALPSSVGDLTFKRRRTSIPAFVTALHDRLLRMTPRTQKNGKVKLVPTCRSIYWNLKHNLLVVDKSSPQELRAALTDPEMGGFKSHKWNAFTRQLFNYGFVKVNVEDEPSLAQSNEWEGKVIFRHPYNYSPLKEDAKWLLVAAKDAQEDSKRQNVQDLETRLQNLVRENNMLRSRLMFSENRLRQAEQRCHHLQLSVNALYRVNK